MMSGSVVGVVLGTLLFVSIQDVASYSKYGRTCKDIGCMRDEVCVMAEDPCSINDRNNCGRYPTCAKTRPGEASCASIVCQQNEFCRTENGVPTCVKRTTANGYESAGVSYVNGAKVSGEESPSKPGDSSVSNSNPYANANAPPAPADPIAAGSEGYRRNNLGYPPYPNSASPANNNGYPPYPSSNNQPSLGYPPYPTNNRMPVAGYPAPYPAPQPYPPAHPQEYPGHPTYPYGGYPNQNRLYTQNMNSVFRRNYNGALATATPSTFLLYLACFVLALASRS